MASVCARACGESYSQQLRIVFLRRGTTIDGTKLVLRLIGVGLLAFAVRFVFGVVALLRQGG